MSIRNILGVVLFVFAISSILNAKEANGDKMDNSIKNIVVKDMEGRDVKLSDYKGKVLLIVNVASKCGYTPQYAGLQTLYAKYQKKGFEILAFPCNDFGGQEPGTNEEIKQFCTSTYNVSFKLFDKVKVVGETKTPLYEKLTNNSVTEKGDIKWNFEKFIIDKEGNIAARFRSKVKPEDDDLNKAIQKELSK